MKKAAAKKLKCSKKNGADAITFVPRPYLEYIIIEQQAKAPSFFKQNS